MRSHRDVSPAGLLFSYGTVCLHVLRVLNIFNFSAQGVQLASLSMSHLAKAVSQIKQDAGVTILLLPFCFDAGRCDGDSWTNADDRFVLTHVLTYGGGIHPTVSLFMDFPCSLLI